jgi:integrase
MLDGSTTGVRLPDYWPRKLSWMRQRKATTLRTRNCCTRATEREIERGPGMRPEEAFRIETANLDFVQRTIFNPSGKTVAARRKLTMTDEVWSILKERTVSSHSPYVFSSPDKPEKPIGSVRKAHDAAVRRAKIVPGFRLYDLRHTYASRAVMAGVDLPTLSALLGHTSVQMTMRYVHPAEEHKREAAAKIERFKSSSAIELATRNQGVTTKVTTVDRVL